MVAYDVIQALISFMRHVTIVFDNKFHEDVRGFPTICLHICFQNVILISGSRSSKVLKYTGSILWSEWALLYEHADLKAFLQVPTLSTKYAPVHLRVRSLRNLLCTINDKFVGILTACGNIPFVLPSQ